MNQKKLHHQWQCGRDTAGGDRSSSSGLYSEESMAVMIRGLAECDNLTTVVEDGLVLFERVPVRDSHES